MRWVRNYTPQTGQAALYRRALWITLAGNIFLAASKGIVAYMTGSAAVFADAANSISDVAYSLMMVLGLWVAMQPPDLSHPQGHARFEPLVGLLVTVSMGFAGFEAGRNAIERFISGGQAVSLGLPSIVLLAAAAIKAGMFVTITRIARQVHSPTLATTAKDNLSDVLTSAAAFIGVFGSHYIHPLLDPAAGILVAIWIFRAAFLSGKEHLGYLTGVSAPPELREKIIAITRETEGVTDVHRMVTEYVGPQVVVDMHINVEGSMTLDEAHRISDEITNRVEALPEIDRVYIHVEPNHSEND